MSNNFPLTFIQNPYVSAYQAFFDQNIQPDFVALENIDEYKLIYLAYPVMMRPQTVAKLKDYVSKGGTLICEGLPAYFGEHGHVGQVQPNYGLDAVFGARETYVEFLADIHDDLKMEVKGNNIFGRYFFQQYETSGGTAVGRYPNGAISAVENKVGSGRTLLMGSFRAAATICTTVRKPEFCSPASSIWPELRRG